jgi:hypothetical protein
VTYPPQSPNDPPAQPGPPAAGAPHPAQPHAALPHPAQPHPAEPHPGQPSAAQPHPGQPYPGQHYPGQPYPAGPGAGASARNIPGLVAFIAGMVLLGVQLVWSVVQALVIRGGSYEIIQVLNGVAGVVNGLLALVAVVFGLIAVLQRGRPKALGGIGLGLGLGALVGVLSGFVIYPITVMF